MKQYLLFLFLAFIGLTIAHPVRAFETRSGEAVTVTEGTTITGSLLAGGNSVTIEGVVDGDLYCAGQTITVTGIVTGDIFCAGQTLDVSGTVGGNIRSIGQLLKLSGIVKRNVVLLGQTITLAPTSVTTGEVISAGQSIRLDGTVARDMTTYSQTLSLGERARIAGDLTYTSPTELSQATGAAIMGTVTYHLMEKPPAAKPVAAKPWKFQMKPWPQNALGGIVLYLVLGVLAVLINPKKLIQIRDQMLARPWYNIGIGVLVMIIAPIVIMMVLLTIIGIPVAILGGITFALVILFSRVYVALVVGERFLFALGKNKVKPLWQMVVGVILVELLIHVPLVGWIFGLVALWWGTGGLIVGFSKRKS